MTQTARPTDAQLQAIVDQRLAEAAQARTELESRRTAEQQRLAEAQRAYDLAFIADHRRIDQQLAEREHAAFTAFRDAVTARDLVAAFTAFADYRGHRIARYHVRSQARQSQDAQQTTAQILPDSDRLRFDGGDFITAVNKAAEATYRQRSDEICAEVIPERPETIADLDGEG
ncbi:hypothetical protein FOS14_18125 [Skermania sp. ID1734]|uniref:hypothetical protein n=1 Tax=Skermania sp. ID1734 TaxID=2597516 RepID=UPI001181727A|nr:hypothetical protein [Skermania sp. ID1734]TSD95283.1 hypothetical protein FOS14_18125 [Skermania sp. ID1734]